LLDVWQVTVWCNEPQGREGQPLLWVLPVELENFVFPAADKPIIAALKT
jgi:8-oxo-dGTP diphosphatase